MEDRGRQNLVLFAATHKYYRGKCRNTEIVLSHIEMYFVSILKMDSVIGWC